MMTSALRRHPSVLVSALVALAVVVLGVTLFSSNEPDTVVAEPQPEPEAPPEPEPEPDPEPEPEPEPPAPVVGEVTVLPVLDVSVHGTRLFEEGREQDAPVAVDEAAVADFVAAIAGWLDEHLTALQQGRELEAAPDGPDDPLGAARLTDSERPVEVATYTFEVAARGAPEWARAVVEVVGTDGIEASVVLVFVPDEPIALLAGELVGAADAEHGTDAPAPEGGA